MVVGEEPGTFPAVVAVESDAKARAREPGNDTALETATEIERHLVARGAYLAQERPDRPDTAGPLEDVQLVEPGMPGEDRSRGRLDGPAEGRAGCAAAHAAEERKGANDVAERAGKNDQEPHVACPFRP